MVIYNDSVHIPGRFYKVPESVIGMGKKTAGNVSDKPRRNRCNYELKYEGQKQKMVINCRNCKQNYSIANPVCIAGILNSLTEVYMVDYIYVSHYLDTMYFGESVEVLERMKAILNQIDNFSLRRPEHQFKLHHPKYKKKIPCSGCPVNPQRLFKQLKVDFRKDMELFHNRINPIMSEVHKFQPAQDYCNVCRYQTIENIDDLLVRFEDFVKLILLNAYKIVYKS